MSAYPLLPDPTCLTLESLRIENGVIVFAARTATPSAACPCCGHPSERVHSRYRRTLVDLPWQGNGVRIVLSLRKLFCDNRHCERHIFAERVPAVAQRYARKTCRLAEALRELAFLAGGEAAARIARAFGLLVSSDALLYNLRRLPPSLAPTPRVLGVDDFAFKKGRRYGTILVDLEQRRPIDLLPDREPATVVNWLKAHPGVQIISRDRGLAYIEGATKGAPNAVQVADRFHLIKNLGDSLERFLLRNHSTVRTLAKTIAAESLTAAEKTGAFPPLVAPPPQSLTPAQQQEKSDRRARRLARFQEVKGLEAQGLSQREIARRTGLARNTVRRFTRPEHFPEIAARPPRRSKIAPYAHYLRQRWKEGCYNGAVLYAEILAQGFTGSLDLVQRFVLAWREKPRSRKNGRHPAPVVPTTGHLAFVLMHPEHPKVSDEIRGFMERLTREHPLFAEAQVLSRRFCHLVGERAGGVNGGVNGGFADWLEKVSASQVEELQGFARGLVQDRAAVEAALSSEWSNGQVEGQVNRLKFLKRQMYGRAGFDLLRARVLYQAA